MFLLGGALLVLSVIYILLSQERWRGKVSPDGKGDGKSWKVMRLSHLFDSETHDR